jgi:hypothetical protein
MENDSNQIYHKISIAESNLKEYNKEDSLFKAINIIHEIFNTDNKGFISIIFTKIMESFSMCDNKTRFIIVDIIKHYKSKLNDIFIKKEIVDIFLDLLTRSDPIARYYSLELIVMIPDLLIKRHDLIHSLLYHLIGENLEEEKLSILNIFKKAYMEGNIDTISLLVDNFDIIMKVFSRNVKLKYFYLLVFKECKFNNNLLQQKIQIYIYTNYKTENYIIIGFLLIILKGSNNEALKNIIVKVYLILVVF